jgi:chemotaxis protein MotB
VSRGGGGRRHHEEEHENHERWLVSYSDMMTVLMALFIVLFAVSQVDQQKFIELRNGLADGFGQSSSVPVPGGSGLLTDDGIVPNPVQLAAGQGSGVATAERNAQDVRAQHDAAAAEISRLRTLQQALEAGLSASGLTDRVRFRVTDRGLVAAIVADDVFFASSSAHIQPTGRHVLEALSPALREVSEEIDVEGHANHLPLTGGGPYPTNWELSTARAASVVRYLVDSGGLNAQRLVASGFADTRPLYPREDSRAVTGNRRVDLVVVSAQPPEVRALLPVAAAEQAEQGEPQESGH